MLKCITLLCLLVLASPVYVKTMELPSTPELEDQPPAHQTLRNPATYQENLEKNLETLLDNARKGNTEEACQQMQHFEEIHQEEAVGTKPLREALISGHLETFKDLSVFYNPEHEMVIEQLVSRKHVLGKLFLKTALLTKDPDAVEKYLTMSGDCPFAEHLNQIIESEGEQVELLTLLINHKAAVNVDCYKTPIVDRGNNPLYSSLTKSPLFYAATLEKLNLISVLLKAGADPRRCYDGRYYHSKNVARIDLLDENVPTSPAIQLIRENQRHKRCCSLQ